MAFCERAGLTATARQLALAATQAVDEAFPAEPLGLSAPGGPEASLAVQRKGRLAGNLFAYSLQAGEYEVSAGLASNKNHHCHAGSVLAVACLDGIQRGQSITLHCRCTTR